MVGVTFRDVFCVISSSVAFSFEGLGGCCSSCSILKDVRHFAFIGSRANVFFSRVSFKICFSGRFCTGGICVAKRKTIRKVEYVCRLCVHGCMLC